MIKRLLQLALLCLLFPLCAHATDYMNCGYAKQGLLTDTGQNYEAATTYCHVTVDSVIKYCYRYLPTAGTGPIECTVASSSNTPPYYPSTVLCDGVLNTPVIGWNQIPMSPLITNGCKAAAGTDLWIVRNNTGATTSESHDTGAGWPLGNYFSQTCCTPIDFTTFSHTGPTQESTYLALQQQTNTPCGNVGSTTDHGTITDTLELAAVCVPLANSLVGDCAIPTTYAGTLGNVGCSVYTLVAGVPVTKLCDGTAPMVLGGITLVSMSSCGTLTAGVAVGIVINGDAHGQFIEEGWHSYGNWPGTQDSYYYSSSFGSGFPSTFGASSYTPSAGLNVYLDLVPPSTLSKSRVYVITSQ